MVVKFPARLAPYAIHAEQSHGRYHSEPESATRSPFQRDRDRIIHAVSFRRLKHKTQVFIHHDGDHYRTRLSHTLEVAQIARSLARLLQMDEDLAEALALAHDLGHPPFGHTGEEVLQECMEKFQGFDHNAQTLRILTKLERRHAGFNGLNLTWETLEGVVKHNGPLTGPLADKIAQRKGYNAAAPLPSAIREYVQQHDLALSQYPSLEAQIAALADDIAYNNHDTDDGLRAGLFTLKEAMDVPLVGEAIHTCQKTFPDAAQDLLIAEAVSDMIGAMVNDVYQETCRRLSALAPNSVEDVRQAPYLIVDFSPQMSQKVADLRAFLWERMYRHYKVNRARSHARRIIRELFDVFCTEPETLPPMWYQQYEGGNDNQKTRAICDYIAGMTDRYAIREHGRLYNVEKWL